MNDALIKVFKNLSNYEKFVGRVFPAKAYTNAVNTLANLDFEVTSSEQVKDLPGFGDGILKKIDAYLSEGTFKRYEEYLSSDLAKFQELAEIKGIGLNKAKALFDSGITSVKQLKDIVQNLTVGDMIGSSGIRYINSIKLGLEFEAHTDKNRMSVIEHDEIANPILEDLRKIPNIIVDAVGSRRRWDGKDSKYTIGDIDVIIGIDLNENKEFYKSLTKYLDEILMSGETKVSGIKNKRQIDFRIVDISNYGSLLLHATGPAGFNVRLRQVAIDQNFILNEYGLFDRDSKQLIASKTEDDIFAALGMTFIPPSERMEFKY